MHKKVVEGCIEQSCALKIQESGRAMPCTPAIVTILSGEVSHHFDSLQNELYSSRIKEFEVRGRQTHPRLEGTDYSKTLDSSSWQILGRFNASNTKGSQVRASLFPA